MSILSKVKSTLDMAQVAIGAVELGYDISKRKLPGLKNTSASELLDLIGTLFESVVAGFSGTKPIGEIKDEIAKTRSMFASTDEKVDERIDEEFDSTTEE